MWWKALDMVLFTAYVLGVIPFLRGFTQGLADARRRRAALEQQRRRHEAELQQAIEQAAREMFDPCPVYVPPREELN